MPSTSKRQRRTGSDRGRSPSSSGSDVQSIDSLVASIGAILFQELDKDILGTWPREYENNLACPFSRRDPKRYISVKDCACTSYGFKEIADLRDHIKRVHSHKYGCDSCKDRFGCRDNSLDDHKAKHRSVCKGGKKKLEVSHSKPEWMSREQDKRYFAVDFRKKQGICVRDQYEMIWESLWPSTYDSKINILSFPGETISRSHLSRVLRTSSVLDEVQALLANFEPGVNDYGLGAIGQDLALGTSQMWDCSQTNGTYIPTEVYDMNTNFDDFTLSSQYDYPLSVLERNSMLQIHSIPKPEIYTIPHTRDSGYGSQGSDHDTGQISPSTYLPAGVDTLEYASSGYATGDQDMLIGTGLGTNGSRGGSPSRAVRLGELDDNFLHSDIDDVDVDDFALNSEDFVQSSCR